MNYVIIFFLLFTCFYLGLSFGFITGLCAVKLASK